ncbi:MULTISPECIES: RNA polymerase sigma factor RpoH [Candidatus Ichthyocystis]|uniref:RNA polymerase sigma factor n=1 Tax=Candidatus Ichthyocystis hellenicum TaxID=1561003 RepID=A0A0S4M3Z2_9BURK|nr:MULTISPECIES: RNA polymerase sigma factor RpoH [Ichthyocystis]CUT17005.1 RNA polymerase Sigma-32 factor [Candidatus Ichthyocystis hellenicum]
MDFALSIAGASCEPNSLQKYIKRVMSYPMLSEEEERECAYSFRLRNDLQSAQRLVLSHLRLVVSISKEYAGYSLPQADLIQEGTVGLMHAVKRFDPERGVRLVTFATYWIKASITSYIVKNWRLVKIATTKAQRKLFFNLRKLKKSLSPLTQAEAEDIAETLGVKKSDVIEADNRLSCPDLSLSQELSPGGEGSMCWEDLIRDERQTPDESVEATRDGNTRSAGLEEALEKLDERARRIISARWLVAGKPLTLQELAKEMGISAERVRQIESQSFSKLRTYLKNLA